MNNSLVIGRFATRAFSLQGVLRGFAVLLAAMILTACGGGGGGGSEVSQPTFAITQQPADQRITVGSAATFRVAANGAATFQWQRLGSDGQWADIAGATQAELALTGLTEADSGRQYRAQVRAGAAVLTSSIVTLTVAAPVPAAVAAQPQDVQVRVGQAPSFSVTATGTSVSYQWQSSTDGQGWADVAGATGETLALPAAVLADSGRLYRVVVRNSLATVTSRAVTLGVLPALAKPQFTAQPQDRSVVAGNGATFTATASGEPAPTLQWETSLDGQAWTAVSGATTSTLVVAGAATADDGRRYRAVATNSQGSETSGVARLTVASTAAPAFVKLPQAATVILAQAVAFEVEASGTPTPTLQWQVSLDDGKSFTNINGATGKRLELPTTVAADDGKLFRVVASNSAGDVATAAAKLTVQVPPQVTQQPQDVVFGTSQSAVTLTVAATGSPAPTVQWQASRDDGATWQDVAGATAGSYTWSPARGDNGQMLRARVSNGAGVTYSRGARISRARWTTASPSFVSGALSAVRWLDAKVAVAVGAKGIIVRTADAGASWQYVQEPMADQPNYYNMAVLDARTVLVTGPGGVMIRSEDAGLTWRTIPVPTKQPDALWLSFRNASIGVMTTYDGAFRTVDGGLTWTRIPSADPAKPLDKLRSVTLHGMVGLTSNETTWFRSNDGGASWQALDMPSYYFPAYVPTYFTFIDDQTVVASGSRFARSTDAGATWRPLASPDGGAVPGALMFSRDGQNGYDMGGVFRSADRGQTWVKIINGRDSFLDADLSPGDVFLSVGFNGELRMSTDQGATWGAPYGSQGLDGVALFGVEFPDNDGRGIAFGEFGQTTALYQTSDGGRHWQLSQRFFSTGAGYDAVVSFLDAQVGMAARNNTTLLRTTDGGRSWALMPTFPTTANTGLTLVDRDTVLMSAPGGVFRSADGGSTWTQTLTFQTDAVDIGLRHVSARGNVVLVPSWEGQMYRSVDGGRNWVSSAYPGRQPVSVTWLSNTTVFVLHSAGVLTRSDDAGLTWRNVWQGGVRNEFFTALRFSADGQLGIMTSVNSIYRSSDGGQTWWRDYDLPFTSFAHGIGFAGSHQPVVVGDLGQVFVSSGY